CVADAADTPQIKLSASARSVFIVIPLLAEPSEDSPSRLSGAYSDCLLKKDARVQGGIKPFQTRAGPHREGGQSSEGVRSGDLYIEKLYVKRFLSAKIHVH
ncbi:MAG TPA: hypothetical protein VN158_08635, partial [Caulobacter sp.]|nr:hypothetical protein [Caulobacter sp.]